MPTDLPAVPTDAVRRYPSRWWQVLGWALLAAAWFTTPGWFLVLSVAGTAVFVVTLVRIRRSSR